MAYSDTFLVEKLREILLRLHPTPQTSPVLHFPKSHNSQSQLLRDVEEGGKGGGLVLGVVRNQSEFDHENSTVLVGKFQPSPSYDTVLTKNLHEFIQVLKMSLSPSPSGTGSNPVENLEKEKSPFEDHMEFNLSVEDISDLNSLLDESEDSGIQARHVFIILLYFLIAVVSIVGNLLVVQLVIRSRRLHTLTHALLANLAVADLFMATINMPASAARVILREWPFGSVLCHLVPFVQVTSVYVTSITMSAIAIDRYSVITNPLGSRMKISQGVILVLGIWVVSALLSLPYAIYHRVVQALLGFGVVYRCQAEFGSITTRQLLTVGTFLAQYLIPLTFTTVSYVSIMQKLRLRSTGLGSTTPRQAEAQSRAKRKTIKMLVLTVVLFGVSWLPINLYHLLTHFSLVRHNSTAILVSHIIAMANAMENPFIYCWFNDHFRREALKWLRCFRTRRCPIVYPGVEVNGMLSRADRGNQGPEQSSTSCRSPRIPQSRSYQGTSRSQPLGGGGDGRPGSGQQQPQQLMKMKTFAPTEQRPCCSRVGTPVQAHPIQIEVRYKQKPESLFLVAARDSCDDIFVTSVDESEARGEDVGERREGEDSNKKSSVDAKDSRE